LEHFKKLQGNVEFHQNKCHPGNAPDMRRPCAKDTDVWAQWMAGLGQNPWSVGPTLQPPMSFLGGDALQEAVEWNPRPGVDGGHSPWPASQHLASYRLNQVGNCSYDSYKIPHCRWNLHTPHSSCSSPLLKVLV
jgi:hypothetical protein